jgi:hypothetical protein
MVALIAGAVWGGWREIKKTNQDDLAKQDERDKSIAERELSYSERLENRVKRLEEQRASLEKDKETLQTELIQLKLAHAESLEPEEILRQIVDQDPGLMWVKKRISPLNFVMVRVSKGYARAYLGGPQSLYDGKTDAAIWGEEVAALFAETDERVYIKQDGEHVEELVIGSPSGAEGTFKGRKYPISLPSGDYIVGIGVHSPDL